MALEEAVIDPAIRAEIEALLTEHAWMIDHHRCENLFELYTEDGKMVGAGHDTVGRAALQEWGRNRAQMRERQARHVISNLRLISIGPGLLRGGCVVTLYRYEGEGVGPARPVAIADLEDTYERCSDGRWRIKTRNIVPVFETPAHPAGIASPER